MARERVIEPLEECDDVCLASLLLGWNSESRPAMGSIPRKSDETPSAPVPELPIED